ncbi:MULTISPECIES: CPBP family intramembrane glutamic endopeptidase [Caulobacter]|jgi:membrane protease YdiL (CAAX protease family)|uniref:Membrane protease YdiL (CAAX protease family) n=1 Tax=Caulobacter rhizosphaerae TaxID=2010972 RepID=A0ABU1MYZ8_9CAUL|nr:MULTISPECIES: CPBP family intramembrane glutamic endopeptidase [Caulobacter]KQZ30007.1 CAAX protease [Caulobacter sp. Root1472]MDR6531060.1 membrane protease YdiL (CAAX protease family) [Caulobacter rhizosphaerae]
MTDLALPPSRRPFLQVAGFRFHPWSTLWPIVLAAALMQTLLVPGREAGRWLYKHNIELFQHQVWVFVALATLFQILTGLLALAVMRRVLPQADNALRWPPGKTFAGLAVAIGVTMGLVMLVADYWPQLLAGAAPDGGYDIGSPGAVIGWLGVMLAAGPNEEIIFRGLLVGMLATLVPGRLRIGPLDLPVAAYVVALLFGLAHYDSFLHNPPHLAIAQQVYAFAWGLTYVWLMERSRSLLAPMIAHGLSDAVEVGAVMVLMAAWG